jgi:hypothetical protein
LHFVLHEIPNQASVGFLEGDCQDTTNLFERGRLAMLQEAEERADRGQPNISRVR